MKSFVLACLVAIGFAALSAVVLNQLQRPVQQAFATSSVRL
ncbi:MAG TPA: hypothetical protein VFQ87_11345 [Bradyrhizobium sp.]|jgi:hypothetical protein|nr:hypothetical protein [Bradyrhizobium sp.]